MKHEVRAGWDHVLLVCARCSQRAGARFGADGDARLMKALKTQTGYGRKRKAEVGIVAVGCLGICPGDAVVVVDSRDPGRWRLVRSAADAAALAPPRGGPDG